MNSNGKELICVGGNIFTYILTAMQTSEVFQVISLVLSIVTSVVILLYRVWRWYKEAKKDGKIDEGELDQLVDIVKEGKEDIEEKAKQGKENDK